MSPTTLFPAWVAHSRMGHNVLYGYATPFVGTSILLECPAIDGDEDYAPIAAEVHVLPLEGPAFYGLQVVDEATVRDRRARGRDWIGGRRALSVATTEPDVAVEVPALDCKPLGTLLSEFTAEDLDALPDGSTFSDGEDTFESKGDEWVNDSGLSSCTSIQLRTHWGIGMSYALTRIGPAPEPIPIPSYDVRPAATVGQRIFIGWIDRLNTDATPARTGGWYLVTDVATTAGIEGAPIVVEKLTGQIGGLCVPTIRYVLTLTEWDQAVSTVLDASGRTLFDEVPF